MSVILDVGQVVTARDDREQETIRNVGEAIARSGPGTLGYLVDPNQEPIAIPRPLYDVLVRAAQMLAQRGAVSVLPADRMLTSQDAADFLNLSLAHLIWLLDDGKIPFERVGRRRRVALSDLMKFDIVRRQERRQHLRNFMEFTEKYGLYEDDEEDMMQLVRIQEADRRGEDVAGR